ncbi:MAG: hypothetical protein ABIE55_04860 [Candidatus Aenigmatarchaeota archaeon]
MEKRFKAFNLIRDMKIGIHGFGHVGRKLADQIIESENPNHVEYVITSLSDRSGVIRKKDGFSKKELKELMSFKKEGKKLKDYEGEGVEYLERIEDSFDDINVLVDATSAKTYETQMNALKKNKDVVSANKIPFADSDYEDFKKLINTANERGRIIDYRVIVSANLGVPTKVEEFRESARGIKRVVGCLSGTMKYISGRINKGVPLSVALKEAKDNFYTEPNPRDDLSGKDAERKAITIARTAGINIKEEEIKVEKIVPDELMDVSVEEFMKGISIIDEKFAQRVKEAKNKNCKLEYVAHLDFEKKEYKIGFEEIPKDDNISNSKGTDNAVTIYPESWEGKQWFVCGPGAGLRETSQGLLAGLDDVRKADERFQKRLKHRTYNYD